MVAAGHLLQGPHPGPCDNPAVMIKYRSGDELIPDTHMGLKPGHDDNILIRDTSDGPGSEQGGECWWPEGREERRISQDS